MSNLLSIAKDPKGKGGITERHIYTQELIKILKTVNEDETITYEKMGAVIGLNVRPQQDGYSYQHSAREILEREENIVFDVIPKIGLKRLTHEKVATGTGGIYIKRKRSLIRRSKRRIRTVDDSYDNLSNDAKMRVTAHRTILAFDNEVTKAKNILKIENKIKESNNLIGFQDTIELFKK
uniref:Uncharacterized protein n=1 Tax=viral metagenome TaxID=1070528 RepID=A0A6H1ZZJ1_9ZZZZ